jgi:hypothetical protein
MKAKRIIPRIPRSERRAALIDGALSLEAMAGVYEHETGAQWKRRTRDARRHARTLRALLRT